MTNFINTLERLRKADLPLCFFALSCTLLADAYCRITGISASFEIDRVPLQHWAYFAGAALIFYCLGALLQRCTTTLLNDMLGGLILRFLDSPQRRADAAEVARNSITPNQLRLFAIQHDNKTAMALYEQHQKARSDELHAELTRQCHAFCLLLALLMDAIAQGHLMRPLTHLPSGSLELNAARLLVGAISLFALYFGVLRGLTWRQRSLIYLPGHEELGLPGFNARHEDARLNRLARAGFPKPSAADVARVLERHAAFR